MTYRRHVARTRQQHREGGRFIGLGAAGRGKKIVKEKMAVLFQSNFDGRETVESIERGYILMCLIWQEREILHNKDLLCKEPQCVYYPLFSVHTHRHITNANPSLNSNIREILSPLCTVWYYPSLHPEMTSYYSRVALSPPSNNTDATKEEMEMDGRPGACGIVASLMCVCVCVCQAFFFFGGGGG